MSTHIRMAALQVILCSEYRQVYAVTSKVCSAGYIQVAETITASIGVSSWRTCNSQQQVTAAAPIIMFSEVSVVNNIATCQSSSRHELAELYGCGSQAAPRMNSCHLVE